MIETILPNLYKVHVPIPNNPLRATNAYIITAADRNLIVDPGVYDRESLAVMRNVIRDLTLDPAKTDYFITHQHFDHYTLVYALKTSASAIYASSAAASAIHAMSTIKDIASRIKSFALRNGFSSRESEKIAYSLAEPESPPPALDCTHLGEGDTLTYGDYRFICIETPGHTRGHLCLFEPKNSLLIAGDHLLFDITPHLSVWEPDDNTLSPYLQSLEKIRHLPVKLVLPGHRSTFTSFSERIDELIRHYTGRSEEVLALLRKYGSLSAVQAASRLTWNINGTWVQFPSSQKLFAAIETLAHFRFLESNGLVRREEVGNQTIYALK